MKSTALTLLFSLSMFSGVCHGRTWTSSDGKKLEAEFVSAEGGQVKLKRADGQVFALGLERLSAEDQAWVKTQPKAAAGGGGDTPVKQKALEGPWAKLVTGSWQTSENDGLKFAVYGPKDANAEVKYPLVLAMHGKSANTENGKQVGGWMNSFTKPENLKERPCFILAPMSAQPESGQGMGWQDAQREQVLDLVKAAVKNLPVDPKRIYIVGHSMGGFGACHVMGAAPRVFAAAIPVAGYSLNDVGELSRKPVWAFHAADDSATPVAKARDFAEGMKKDKLFKYTESPTGGHGVVDRVFNDPETQRWLFSQQLK